MMGVLRTTFLASTVLTFLLANVECKTTTIECEVSAVVDDAENLECSSNCSGMMKSMWFEGFFYHRMESLSILGKMAKVTFNKDQLVSCEVVDAKTDEALQEQQMQCEASTPAPTPAPPCGKPTPTPATTPDQTYCDLGTTAETTPAPTTPAETTPAETTPAETTPAGTTPAGTTPALTTPAETTRVPTTLAETTPAETTPAPTTPAETTPAPTTPAETTPAETTPAATTAETPAETTPAETTPAETTTAKAPAETTRVPTTLSETTPAPTTPAETTPAPTTPVETTPAPTTPAPTTPAPTTPAPTTPAETTLAPTTPAPTTPAETTLAPTTPAPTTPAPTTPAPTTLTSDGVTSMNTSTSVAETSSSSTESPVATSDNTSPSSGGTTTAISRELVCPSGWKLFGDACFLMSSEDDVGNRASAKNFCEKIGSQLASIRSEEENTFITENFEFEDAWIGLHDQDQEGTFQWDDAATFNYSNWGSNEPNNFGLFGEDCVEIAEDGTWNDEGCAERGRRFLCRRTAEWSPREECPDDWTSNPSTGSCYFLSSYSTNYADAVEKCPMIGSGAELLLPRDEAENEFLSGITNETLWIGLSDRKTEGHFVDEKGNNATYVNWNSGEPNDLLGQDCAQRNSQGMWSDASCFLNHKFICVM
ncbi:uncharacterized protein LOC143033374 [Oratosquilla oratoria]|uniref:uncharacterized protein LOC143033374 n=1 Tax=Oratosquilla oratoria TaxID=337810 RepID=UPI003F76F520